jgi:hypothetical protein
VIIRELKPLEELLQILDRYERVAIIGCAGCYGEGGAKQVEDLTARLTEKGVEVVGTGVTGRQCSWLWKPQERGYVEEIVEKAKAVGERGLDPERIREADVFLSMACPVGAQTLEKVVGTEAAIAPAFNGKAAGRKELGEFQELCITCGNCIIYRTGGICPYVQCPKSMPNGPCGGIHNGNCETMKETRPCGWIRIYYKLKALGELDRLREIHPNKDHSLRLLPRSMEVPQ